MRGFLALAREHGAAALDNALEKVKRVDEYEGVSDIGGIFSGSGTDGVLRGVKDPVLVAALQRVTHTNSAVVSADALDAVLKMALKSEESLAVVLKHIEECVITGPQEWRKIHGALKLLDLLLREAEKMEEPLVGRLWFETKVQIRLNSLVNFEFAEDSRVALVVRRAALNARTAAEKTILVDEPDSPVSTPRQHCPRKTADSDGEKQADSEDNSPDSKAELIGKPMVDRDHDGKDKELDSKRGKPSTARGLDFGQRERSRTEEASKTKQDLASQRRVTVAALEALSDPSTRAGRQALPAAQVSSPSSAGDGPAVLSRARSWCRCFWLRSSAADNTKQRAQSGEISEVSGLVG